MNRFDPEKLREAVSKLNPITLAMMNELLAFQERHGLSSAEMASHVRSLIDLFQQMTRGAKGPRPDTDEP